MKFSVKSGYMSNNQTVLTSDLSYGSYIYCMNCGVFISEARCHFNWKPTKNIQV